MKLNKIFAAIMAVVTLVGFSACKNEGQDVIGWLRGELDILNQLRVI